MDQYLIRKARKEDIGKIVEIYNSNGKFLINHLGYKSIDNIFVIHEMEEMEIVNFLSCVITDVQTENIIGVIDYKEGNTVYLSLVMIDSKLHGNGIGTTVYRIFEKNMLELDKHSIRIDVVNDYEGNVIEF